MNRDESLSPPCPRTAIHFTTTALYPVDPPDGTWFGYNQFRAFVELQSNNGKTVATHCHPPQPWPNYSRVVARKVSARSYSTGYAPFDDYALFKLIISDRGTLIECIWDGRSIRTNTFRRGGVRDNCWTSSGLATTRCKQCAIHFLLRQ